jgi:hypothetical protein
MLWYETSLNHLPNVDDITLSLVGRENNIGNMEKFNHPSTSNGL